MHGILADFWKKKKKEEANTAVEFYSFLLIIGSDWGSILHIFGVCASWLNKQICAAAFWSHDRINDTQFHTPHPQWSCILA